MKRLRWIIGILLLVTVSTIAVFGLMQRPAASAMAAQKTDTESTRTDTTASSDDSLSPSAAGVAASANTASPAPSSTPVPTTVPTPTATPTPTPVPKESAVMTGTQNGGIDWYGGYADPRTISPEIIADPEDVTVLVNKYFTLPDDYVPELVLADSSKNQSIRPEADDAWDLMRAACETDTGYTLYLCSGYRTLEEQAALFSTSISKQGVEHAISRNAYPGRSEHNLGLALDISTTAVGSISYSFGDTKAGMWVSTHAYQYGFILRYPQDKSDITGYVYEPWHYRYVGIDLAATLYASGQTLEEYYGKMQVLPDEG